MILIVDDDENFLLIAERALRRAGVGADIRIARDGGEALRLLGLAEGPDGLSDGLAAVLLDLNMPVVTGWEVLDRIRQTSHTHDLPVIVVSSSRHPDDIRRSYEFGANSYISKRYDPTSPGAYLAEAVRYWAELNEAPGQEGRTLK